MFSWFASFRCRPSSPRAGGLPYARAILPLPSGPLNVRRRGHNRPRRSREGGPCPLARSALVARPAGLCAWPCTELYCPPVVFHEGGVFQTDGLHGGQLSLAPPQLCLLSPNCHQEASDCSHCLFPRDCRPPPRPRPGVRVARPPGRASALLCLLTSPSKHPGLAGLPGPTFRSCAGVRMPVSAFASDRSAQGTSLLPSGPRRCLPEAPVGECRLCTERTALPGRVWDTSRRNRWKAAGRASVVRCEERPLGLPSGLVLRGLPSDGPGRGWPHGVRTEPRPRRLSWLRPACPGPRQLPGDRSRLLVRTPRVTGHAPPPGPRLPGNRREGSDNLPGASDRPQARTPERRGTSWPLAGGPLPEHGHA